MMGMVVLGACDQLPVDIDALLGQGGLDPATAQKLQGGDIPGVYADLKDVDLESIDAETAKYLAFTQFARGEYDRADATLAAAEKNAPPEEKPGIALRRALVALRANDLEGVKTHAMASGLPEGKLLAAEVHVINFDQDAARKLFQDVQSTPGAVGATASRYLELINGGPDDVALAEITALWALGDRAAACEQAEEVIPGVEMEDGQKKAELQLLWAGRAVTSGFPAVASVLLDDMTELPSRDQAWRRQAILGMIAIANGEYEQGIVIFEQLLQEEDVPGQGIADAVGTAIALCKDPEVAKRLAADLESVAVSKGLQVQGLADEALRHAPRDSQFR